MFKCEKCGRVFQRIDNLTRHKENKKHMCTICNAIFKRSDNLKRHISKKHSVAKQVLSDEQEEHNNLNIDVMPGPSIKRRKVHKTDNNYKCELCNIEFSCKSTLNAHIRSKQHIDQEGKTCYSRVQKINSAFNNRIATYRITCPSDKTVDIKSFLYDNKTVCIDLFQEFLTKFTSYKVNFEIFAYFMKVSKCDSDDANDECEKFDLKSFNTKFKSLFHNTDLSKICDDFFESISKKGGEFQERDSGWALFAVSHLILNINKYQPIRGGSYLPLPPDIQYKRACINIIKNDDA
jgi:uncharacterized C2H2 Zn-finger protein